MRSLLLFIGSCLYPTVMVIISPLLAFLYVLLGTVMLSRYLRVRGQWVFDQVITFTQQTLHLSYKKQQLVFRPKAVRLH